MPKKLLFLVFMGLFVLAGAQEKNDDKKDWGINFSGFVNAQIIYDTRQMADAREGMVSLFPKAPEYDSDGKDINARPSFNQLAMTSRLKASISGPDVWGAKATALIEGDFTGQSNSDNNGFRLREAWAKLQWENTSILVGSYWHPLYAFEIRPVTLGLNTGAPFHAFSRFNQVRVEQKIKNLTLILFAGMQRDYASNGPLGRTSVYERNAAIPNLDFQLQYHFSGHTIGAGIDYKILQPRLDVVFNDSLFKADDRISSLAATVFGRFEFEKFTLKMQSIWGENLTEHIMLGGYAEKSIDTVNHTIDYVNSSQVSVWMDVITKGKKIKLGLFAGYAKNLGLNEAAEGKYYGTGYTIDYLYRFSPRIQYHVGKMMFATELEYTVAAYGNPTVKDKVENAKETGNLRVLLGVFYFF
jgi:hypothetical protein